MLHGIFNERVPVVPGLDHHGDPAAGVLGVDRQANRCDLQHRAGKTVVGHQQVGTPADDQQGLAGRVRRAHGVDDFGLATGLNIAAGGSADSGGGQGGEQNLSNT